MKDKLGELIKNDNLDLAITLMFGLNYTVRDMVLFILESYELKDILRKYHNNIGGYRLFSDYYLTKTYGLNWNAYGDFLSYELIFNDGKWNICVLKTNSLFKLKSKVINYFESYYTKYINLNFRELIVEQFNKNNNAINSRRFKRNERSRSVVMRHKLARENYTSKKSNGRV